MTSAGSHGPVSDQDMHDVMCSNYCIMSDVVRFEAMMQSGCSCIDLSTPNINITFTRKGDWCYENTGHMLCEQLEVCGSWNCDLADFGCKRNEYNRIFVNLKGYGDSCSAGKRQNITSLFILIVILLVTELLLN